MGRGYGNPEIGRHEQGGRATGFGTKTLHRGQLRDPQAHGADNPPATHQRAQRHRSLTRQHHPKRNLKVIAEVALRIEQHRDDAHGLLRIVAAMAERIE
jgi:hypothetical protein